MRRKTPPLRGAVNLGEAIVELGFSKSDEVKAATDKWKDWWPRTAA